jgi:hypothetical protein
VRREGDGPGGRVEGLGEVRDGDLESVEGSAVGEVAVQQLEDLPARAVQPLRDAASLGPPTGLGGLAQCAGLGGAHLAAPAALRGVLARVGGPQQLARVLQARPGLDGPAGDGDGCVAILGQQS